MSVTDPNPANQDSAAAVAPVPKPIVNAQTVCNEKNEKGKPCWGHLKQLGTAGEPAEIHLRGDDVLFKCQTCGTLYMGPPLGHVRDPNKQSRFVEAELSALLQAAGGTLPVIKKDARGVFVIVEGGGEHSHAKPAAAKAPAPGATAPKTPETPEAPKQAAPAPAPAPAAPKPAERKAGAQPNRQLFKRSTYSGVKDIGPVAGETFEQKVARLKELSAAAKRRAEEGGEPTAPAAVAPAPKPTEAPAAPATAAPVESTATAPSPAPATSSPAPAAHKATGKADRTLMKRSTYGDVVDTGPVPGETFEQKVARLSALAAAAKQRAEG
ncbi:MAG TPA: hypothetical protein VF074_14240 [Pyrinomonadaceae bacterium]